MIGQNQHVPNAKPIAQAQVDNLQRRAVEIAQRLGKLRVRVTMNKAPSCIEHLVRTLDSLGYTEDRIKAAP